MAEQPKSTKLPIPRGTVSPTSLESNGVLERLLDYIDQPLNTEDPIQNLVSGVANFVPGISTALARRRGDSLGEALSYLDVLGGGGTSVKMGSLFLVKRKKELEKAIKEIDTDPILSKNPFMLMNLTEELGRVNKQLNNQMQQNIGYEEMLKTAGIKSKETPKRAIDDTEDIFDFFGKNKHLEGLKPKD
tara:strand:- start:63 stop:629 length:567 start_codon:yes stop_codon:yes gene_type:complete